MLNSRIDIPDQIPGMTPEAVRLLTERVASATEVLRGMTADLYGHTVRADWTVPSTDPAGHVELSLSLGSARNSWSLAQNDLAVPPKVREHLREQLWQLTSAYLKENIQEILRLAAEIKADRELAGV